MRGGQSDCLPGEIAASDPAVCSLQREDKDASTDPASLRKSRTGLLYQVPRLHWNFHIYSTNLQSLTCET